MKKQLSSEELLNLPKEAFIQYMNTHLQEQYENIKDVGESDYANYSIADKVNFWCERLNKQMRIQAEAGLDDYAIYNSYWYNAMLRLEPDFDSIIDRVFERFTLFGWEWKKEEYLKRITK